MIAVDTNILVYAHRRDSEWHAPARRCIEQLAQGLSTWAIPWPCLHEFISITTHPKIYSPPSSLPKALAQVSAWLESPSLALLAEEAGYWPVLESLATAAKLKGPMVHDARVAALCIRHGVRELWTADRDFTRLSITTRNPLIEA